MTSMPTPPSFEVVPVKYSSMNSCASPTASNACAPAYDEIVEMPIFDMIFSTPLPSALITLCTASSGVTPVMTPARTRSSQVSMARYGLTADAP